MALLQDLPNELVMQIIEYLQTQWELKSITLINRRFHALFNDYLYRINILHGQISALFWSASSGHEATARKVLHLGADVNGTLPEALSQLIQPIAFIRNSITALHLAVWSGRATVGKVLLEAGADIDIQALDPGSYHLELCTLSDHLTGGSSLLHIAAWRGNLAILKLLLEARANLEARDYRNWTPLYAALASGHEKIALAICKHMGSAQVNTCILDLAEGLTPLHAAARYGLSKSVRYFVELGTDVDIKDHEGKTALYHVLLAHDFGSRRYGEVNPSVDDVYKTVQVLLYLGANPELEIITSTGEYTIETTKACQLGSHNPDCRVRELFEGYLFPRSSRIGRAWMPPTGVSPYRTIPKALPAIQGDCGDFKSEDNQFPALGNPSTPELETPSPNSPWSHVNVENLISKMATTEEPKLPASAPLDPIEPFPQLSSNIPKSSLNIAASNMWANLEKPKQHVQIEEKCSKSDSGGKNSSNNNRKTGHRKGRWKPLAL